MTPGRRRLSYDNFDEVMCDVVRLLDGCTTVGNWSLAQICHHLATTLRRTVELPASTPQDSSQWIGEERKRQIFESGQLPEGFPAPPAVVPTAMLGERREAETLRQAIAYYKASSGPVIPHPYIGPLTKAEWDRFHLIHCAHHLSFAIPMA
jgi:hypothetical protein